MNRRRFLRVSALAAAPLVARRALAERAAPDPNPIVIVGAGLAGLHAARLLGAAGRAVVVLEARPSAGGRVRTLREGLSDGLYGEAGPIRIAGSHQRVLRLVQQHGLNVIPFDSADGEELVRIGGRNLRASQLATSAIAGRLKAEERGLTQGALLARYVTGLPSDLGDPAASGSAYARWAELDRLTWPEWLRSRGASDAAVSLMTLGGDSRELSALYVLRQYALLKRATAFFKIEGGMDRLPRAMAAALGPIVRYQAVVKSIDRTGGPIRIAVEENGIARQLVASRLILTVPLSVLGTIDVRPAWSASRQRGMAGLPYFPATRLLTETRTRFWHRSGLSGYVRTDQPAEIWDSTYEVTSAGGVLGATVGGALGREMAGIDERQSTRRAQQLMRAVFPLLTSEEQHTSVHRWALDPWARGAFAVFHPGQMTSMMPDIASPEERIHFAGEHTSAWMGWMEGALESAERVVREVVTS